jgi:uncharacterized membrane protein YbhN (UPF0104 family)
MMRLGPGMTLLIVTLSAVHILGRLAVLPALLFDVMRPAQLDEIIAQPLLLFYAGALVPAPAGGGLIEIAFATRLHNALGPAVAAALLWWRVYTFHLLAAAGGLVLAWTALARWGQTTSPRPRATLVIDSE